MFGKLVVALFATLAVGIGFGMEPANADDSSGSSSTAPSGDSGGAGSSAAAGSTDSNPPSSGVSSSSGDSGGNTIKPMYDGQFKCKDGYDPDTDPSLHPPGQDPKVRMLVNAQAQKAHEDKAASQQKSDDDSGAKNTSSSSNSGQAPPVVSAPDPKKDDAKKDGDKKNQDKKKDGEKKDGDKKDSDKKDSDKKDGEKKDGEKKDDKKSESDKTSDGSKEPYNPLKAAIFDIQCGKYQNSAETLSKLVASDAKNVQAHYLLAVSYVALRQYQRAAEQYNIVVKLAPNSKIGQLAEEGLKRISN